MKTTFSAIIFLMVLTSFDPTDTKNRMVFPDFTEGTVIFKNGTTATAPLNYDTYEEEMIFNNNGKIMAVATPETILRIEIKNRTFEWLDGDVFLEKIELENGVIYRRNRNQLMSKGKGTSYGGVSNASSVATVSSLPRGSDKQAKDLKIDEDFELIPDNLFYARLGSSFKLLSTAKQISKVYNADKKELENFITSQKLSLQRTEDVIQIIRHCKTAN